MERINRFWKIIEDLGCDSALVTNRTNVRYLSGFTGSAGFLLITKTERLLFTDFRYIEQATDQAKVFEVKNVSNFKIADYAAKFNSTAFENASISYYDFLRYDKIFKKLVPMGNTIMQLRSIKTADEINNIRTAAKIADDAFSHILTFIKEGMTEIQVARELDFYMLSHGAQKTSFDTIVAAGAHGSLPHAEPGNRVIKNGNLVVMDYGCVYNGYCSDMTRTVGIGNIDDEYKEAYNTVLQAQLSCLDMIKPGVNCASVHKNAFDIIDSKYKGLFGHSLGHGVGLEVHEHPGFSNGWDIPAPVGCVLSVEPGVYIPGKCGVRIEDLIVVTDDGYENLCSSPKELILI